jgi:hypothetical protein
MSTGNEGRRANTVPSMRDRNRARNRLLYACRWLAVTVCVSHTLATVRVSKHSRVSPALRKYSEGYASTPKRCCSTSSEVLSICAGMAQGRTVRVTTSTHLRTPCLDKHNTAHLMTVRTAALQLALPTCTSPFKRCATSRQIGSKSWQCVHLHALQGSDVCVTSTSGGF